MASFSKEYLSGSTTGRPIKVVATATPGTTIHTASAVAGVKDELWIWLSNTSSTDVTVTCEHGGTTSPDDLLKFIVPAGDTILALAGTVLGNGLLAKMFASVANVVTATGFVNRIS